MPRVNFRKNLSGLFILVVLAGASQAADVNYPYGRVSLKLPPAADPFPGLGNYYSTLSIGMKSALWNPASLGKLKLSEVSFSMISALGSYDLDRITRAAEKSGTFEVGAGSGSFGKAAINYALFYRSAAAVAGIGTAVKEVEINSNLNYATSGTGINFSAAQKINDWLTVGFAANNPVEAGLSLAGDFPLTVRMGMDLKGKSLGDLQILADGKMKYTFTSGGTVTTPETVTAVYDMPTGLPGLPEAPP